MSYYYIQYYATQIQTHYYDLELNGSHYYNFQVYNVGNPGSDGIRSYYNGDYASNTQYRTSNQFGKLYGMFYKPYNTQYSEYSTAQVIISAENTTPLQYE